MGVDQKREAQQRTEEGKPSFCAMKPAPEPVKRISTYAANDLGKEIKLITDVNGNIVYAGYLKAIELTAAQGLHLPSNVLLDEYLVGSMKWRELEKKNCYVVWAREILAYPENDGTFVQGRDVIDSETGWTLPANYVPEEAIGVKNVGLFIDPEGIKKENGRVVVYPKTILVLMNLIQKSRGKGKVDPTTRIPLEVDDKLLNESSESELRMFLRETRVGVRPLVRGFISTNIELNRIINANTFPSMFLGIGGV